MLKFTNKLIINNIITLTTLLLSANLFCQTDAKKHYINTYQNMAIEQMVKYKIPASITLAQGILESSSGKSYLATKANNHFGIKCHDWTGKTVYQDDDAENECFRKYKSVEQSYEDHSIFLATRSRYSELFELNILDYKGWAKGLKKAGYATNPQYPELLIGIIEEYKLYKYDRYVMGYITEEELYQEAPHIPSKVRKNIEHNSLEQKSFDNSKLSNHSVGICECMNEALFVEIYRNRAIYVYNGIFVTYLENSETINDVAKDLKVPKRRLLKFNDLPRKAILKQGDIIYLDYKNKRSKTKYHYVKYDNETLWSISQCYSITTKELMKRNKISSSNTVLPIGTRIKLKGSAVK